MMAIALSLYQCVKRNCALIDDKKLNVELFDDCISR